MKYKTKNKTLLISFLEKHSDEHFTIDQIREHLPEIPQASMYRLMDSLVESGKVRKFVAGQNDPCCFQYVDDEHCHHHFHLICERCGKLIHLECDEVDHLLHHIDEEHGFSVDISKVNFYGLCEDCKQGDKK